MRTLVKIADGSILDLKKQDKDEAIDFAKLIEDLGSNLYRVREAASTKLRLLGEPAVPYLEKAIKAGKDLETVRRAEKLWTQINNVAAERRKELLSKDLPKFVRPTFAFVPKAETRAGFDVHIIKIKFADKDIPLNGYMKQLLGPQWDHLRLAMHGEQIVALLGSDVELFEAALTNVKEGKPGLAASKNLARFSKQANPARSLEFHVSVQSLLNLIEPGGAPRPPSRSPRSPSPSTLTASNLICSCRWRRSSASRR